MQITNHSTLPAYAPMTKTAEGLVDKDPEGLPVWSNETPPPAIGEKINIRVNGIGPARVDGYYTQEGYLGLVTTVDAWPPRLAAQNGEDRTCHVFGAEISQ